MTLPHLRRKITRGLAKFSYWAEIELVYIVCKSAFKGGSQVWLSTIPITERCTHSEGQDYAAQVTFEVQKSLPEISQPISGPGQHRFLSRPDHRDFLYCRLRRPFDNFEPATADWHPESQYG
jgi:hypothetical protein